MGKAQAERIVFGGSVAYCTDESGESVVKVYESDWIRFFGDMSSRIRRYKAKIARLEAKLK